MNGYPLPVDNKDSDKSHLTMTTFLVISGLFLTAGIFLTRAIMDRNAKLEDKIDILGSTITSFQVETVGKISSVTERTLNFESKIVEINLKLDRILYGK